MALTIAGAHVAVGPLLSGCYSIVKGISQLHQSYKFMPLTLSRIVLTCNTTSTTLKQVNLTLADYCKLPTDFYQELLDQFDGIKIGCTMTLSLLDTHVSELLDVGVSDIPLKAQNTSRTDKLKALYNESDMKELFGQLKDYNALLDTILNHLQSDKQNRMMDMMTNQEKTLESMFRAHESLRKHLQAADPLLDNDSETASILTSTTNLTNLTVFDFDIAIKATAVYQRCMNRRSDRTSLLSLGLSTSQHTSSSKTKDTATEEKHDLASEPAIHREITEEDVSPQENCEKDTIEDISEEILRRTTPRDIQPDSSDSDSRLDSHYEYSIGESNPDYVPPMRLSIRPRDTMVAASSSETSKPTFSYSREAHMLESSSQAMETMQHYNSGLPPNRVPSGVTVGNTSAPSAANKVIPNSSIVPSVKVAKPSRPGPSSEGGTQMSMRLLYDHQENITNVAISSKLVLATASPKMVRLWNLSTSKEVGKIPAKTYRYTESGLVFSPDGTLLAAAHLTTRKVTSTVSVWNPNTKARVCTLRVHNDSELRISAIAISADNKLIACSQEITRPFGEISSTTMLYEIATGHKLGEFPKLDTRTRMLSFAQEDRRLLCCSGDLVRMWNVATYRLTRFCARLGHAIYHPVFTKDSMLVSTNGFDRIYKFDWGSGVRKASITVPENIRCLSCSPGTRAIAFAGQNGLVGTWDPRTGIVRQLKQDDIHDGNVNMEAVAISPDGQTVFFGGYAGKLWSWSMDNEGHEGEHGWI